MKRSRAQNPKLQDQEPQDPAAATGNNPNPNPKPQRRAKQPRQPKAATAGKKTAAAREVAAAAASAAGSPAPAAEMAPVVCVSAGGIDWVACGLPADWDEMDGANGSPWWTFGVEEEKLLGWFPFVEEDFRSVGGVGPAAAEAAAVFDDDIWRIHQIYEIPNYATK